MIPDRNNIGRDHKVVVIAYDNVEGRVAAWVCKRKLGEKCDVEFIAAGTPAAKFSPSKMKGLDDKQVLVFGVAMPPAVIQTLAGTTKGAAVFINDFNLRRAIGSLKSVKYQAHVSLGAMAWTFLAVDESKPWIVDWSDNAENWRWPSHDYDTLNAWILKTSPEPNITYIGLLANQNPVDIEAAARTALPALEGVAAMKAGAKKAGVAIGGKRAKARARRGKK